MRQTDANRGHDLVTIGRCGVDIYPLQVGRGLEEVESFGKFLGGSAMNVAVAAAQLGRDTALISAVGNEPFGRFVRQEMRRLKVSDTYVRTSTVYKTPITFCEIFPPDNFPLYFYRDPSAPDLELEVEHLPLEAIERAAVMWFTGTGFSVEPTRSTHLQALSQRQKDRGQPGKWTVLDLDYRPTLWQGEAQARHQLDRALGQVDVAVGNVEECRVAVGENDPDRAADAMLERGAQIAIVKQGQHGTLAKTTEERVRQPVTPVDVYNGLGAGDAFGGALCHALLSGWSLPRSIHFASTAGAIVASRLDCAGAMPSEAEVFDTMAAYPHITPQVTRQ